MWRLTAVQSQHQTGAVRGFQGHGCLCQDLLGFPPISIVHVYRELSQNGKKKISACSCRTCFRRAQTERRTSGIVKGVLRIQCHNWQTRVITHAARYRTTSDHLDTSGLSSSVVRMQNMPPVKSFTV